MPLLTGSCMRSTLENPQRMVIGLIERGLEASPSHMVLGEFP